jgi:transporter family-2 protein
VARIWIFLLMVFAGAVSALQPGINARLAQKVGVLESAFVSFAGGALCLAVVVFLFGKGNLREISAAAPWEVLGGLMGAVYVTCLVLAVPRIGTAAAMAGAIAAQLAASLILDSAGAFGFQKLPLDFPRVAGVLFLILGSLLILRK